jgi:hypothetical protein
MIGRIMALLEIGERILALKGSICMAYRSLWLRNKIEKREDDWL